MKNVIKKSILLVTVFTTMLSIANEIPNNIKKTYKETALTINNVSQGDLLTIKDYNGIVLYKELIKSNGTYKKGFDLTALPSGDYFFEVDKDMEIKTIPFTVNYQSVVFNKEKETSIYKPYLRQKGDLILISKLAPNLEPLKVSIYSELESGSELLYTQNIEGLQSIDIAYRLKKGSFKIVFNSNGKEFTKFINN
ncbi:hypothetical protein [Thalassobellus suaedae]|uniref:Uncharacterized protein n=1 Tax=Thalassobellus suaedae TaxID=3074124 RepID=A0ABY9Y7W0_9FLAO|nr:hypothetical protein RHP49_06485 [Flavobacteriaceae bacterium HL-DH10]